MKICRLCLQPGGRLIPNNREILNILKVFFPYINSCLKSSNLILCDVCVQNIHVVDNLITSLKHTNEKITNELEKSNSNCIKLINLTQKVITLGKDENICRICLRIVTNPQIFLYDHNPNLFRHDLIFAMLKFCKMIVNCDVSDTPLMCYQCWENLQVSFTFKKNYLEINNKIRKYCNHSKINMCDITEEILAKLSENLNVEIIKQDIEIDDCTPQNQEKKYSLRKKIKLENGNININSYTRSNLRINEEYSGLKQPKVRKRHRFTREEDTFLVNLYLKMFKNNKEIDKESWKLIQLEFNDHFNSDLTTRSLKNRVNWIPKQKDTSIKTPSRKNNSKIKISAEKKSTSDGLGNKKEEVKKSSFAPFGKPEPLSDTEEDHVIESTLDCSSVPPSDIDSDCESLPLPILERMDLPPLSIKIENIYSLKVKRETLDMFAINEKTKSNVLEDFKTCKRMELTTANNEKVFKCMECNFETKWQRSADRHAKWHSNPKKGYECSHCTFITSKYYFLQHHLATNHQNKDNHDDSNDLPVLVPFTV